MCPRQSRKPRRFEDSSMNTPPPSQLPQPVEQLMPWVRHPGDQTTVPRKVSLLVSVRFITQHLLTHSRLKAGSYTLLILPAFASMQLPLTQFSQIHLVFP